MRRRWGRWSLRASVLATTLACVVGGLQGASATTAPAVTAVPAAPVAAAALAAANPPAPGLPPFYVGTTRSPCVPSPTTALCTASAVKATEVQASSAISALTVGTSDLTKVKQAIRLPITLVGGNIVGQYYYDIKGRVRTLYRNSFPTTIFVQSPTGSRYAFGELPPITSTALAFGIIPVTVTAHLSQERDAADLPVPIQVKVDTGGFTGPFYDVSASGRLSIRLDGISVDGKPLDVGTSCRSASLATLRFTGKYFPGPPTNPTPHTYYFPNYGGDLYGNLDIPAFTGCRSASGEDLSRLFTSALSSESNPVHLVQGVADAAGNLGCPAEPSPDLECTVPKNTDRLTGPGAIPSQPPADDTGRPYVPNPSPCAWPEFLPNLPASRETPSTDLCLKP